MELDEWMYVCMDGWTHGLIKLEAACYLGGIDFMLLSGSSNTLGQASGVTEI